jgi:WD40 repeat protein
MSFVRFCVLLVAVGWSSRPASAFFPLPAFDRHGSPLPMGAVSRLGTINLRAGCGDLHFSPDGRTLFGNEGDRRIRVWDARTGSPLDIRPLLDPAQLGWARSADGRTLLVSRGKWIDLVDVASGQSLECKRPTVRRFPQEMAVSNDRRWVLFPDLIGTRPPRVRGGFAMDEPIEHLRLWDTTAGTARTLAEDECGIVALAFSKDGKRAVSSDRSHTRGWDTATGKRIWEVERYNAEQVRFTPDGKYVIAAPGDGRNDWHVWDAATGKPTAGLKPPTVGYAWMFAVDPDGAKILIPTYTEYVLWDLKAGEALHRWPGPDERGRGTFAPDGRSVVTYDTILRRWDLATGKNLYADVGALGHVAPVRRVFFSPDGKRLVSIGEDRTARVWDVPGTKLVRTISIDKPIDVWALTPDGSTLVGIDERMIVHRWLVGGGEKTTVNLRDAQQLSVGLRARDAHVLPDGTLAIVGWPRGAEFHLLRFSFSFWDLRTGRLIRWGGDPGKEFRADYCRLSPDGGLVAAPEATYDTRTGAQRGMPPSPFANGGHPLFAPDGRVLATATARDTRIWELATGRVIADLPLTSLDHATFMSGGRRLAAANARNIAVWDLGLHQQIADWHAPALVDSITFSPDGRTVATGHRDGTILIWPVPAPVLDGPWSAGEANSAWDALADDFPANALPALWQLNDYPTETVRFLRGKAKLAAVVAASEIDKVISNLDSPRFAEREAASKRLREFGRAAEGPLRQALKRGPSSEQSTRIEALLAGLEPVARPRGEDLRAIRAVAVMEYIGTDEARRVLNEWAERGSPPRLADEAARALERLNARK